MNHHRSFGFLLVVVVIEKLAMVLQLINYISHSAGLGPRFSMHFFLSYRLGFFISSFHPPFTFSLVLHSYLPSLHPIAVTLLIPCIGMFFQLGEEIK